MDNTCVYCGAIIPEGRQVCPICETKAHMSCEGCAADLGGGLCRDNLEAECAAGGGFEAYRHAENEAPSESCEYETEIMKRIYEQYGEEYILRQLAEECAELAQAALKMIRARRGETPVTYEQARIALIEEITDVDLMTNFVEGCILGRSDFEYMNKTYDGKIARMKRRMLG